ncbi:hypothetical protein D1818_05585 [Aquimarina sp. BL5]|uniref:hypothetical protein n=1 Tax=Aquimarina sp. BL5 TaxID=1714860 RepID=UPI000E5493AD|nr:hypothetical protein [Aquimarina sp. BL5]AXT50326.1 hypothetical protein D1818_05585 [Aquimarina sp. BL5]RKM93069.1 hypothetical protein D7036_22480 [Aquimarina sp. BL5]
MQKLSYIIVFLIFSNSFCQEANFVQVKKIDERNETLIDTLKTEKWNSIDERRKLKIRNYIVEQNLRIKSDSSSTTQILYYGLPEKIKIITSDFEKTIKTEKPSEKYFYEKMICYPVKEKAYELITFDRNDGIKEFKIYFTDSKRFANLKVDTKFSEIYINPQFDIELVEFEEGTFASELDENGIPKPAKEKLIKMDDEIIVDQRYARKKQSL